MILKVPSNPKHFMKVAGVHLCSAILTALRSSCGCPASTGYVTRLCRSCVKGSQVVACPEEWHGVLSDTLLLFLENTIPARVLVLPNSFLGKSCWQAFPQHSAASRGSC